MEYKSEIFRKLFQKNAKIHCLKGSSNVNEVIREVLKSLFIFYKKISQAQKKTKQKHVTSQNQLTKRA